jgi:methionyl-tRNA formyltransferase
MSDKINLVFLGTPQFACPFLEKLANDQRFKVQAVITQEDKPVGRKKILTASPVKQMALQLNLPLYQPSKLNQEQALLDELTQLQPDFLIVVAYGQILSSKVLKIPKIKPINVHGSILPMYRGASPIEQAILNGDEETGLSVMEMVKAMDAGPVYQVLKCPININDTNTTLREKLSHLGAHELPDLLIKIKKGDLIAQPQLEEQATYCQKITKEDGQIHPAEQTALQIYNRWRAFIPWPGINFKIQNKNLKLLELEIVNSPILAPGKIDVSGKNIFLGTSEGTLSILKLQLEGKNAQEAAVFLSGNRALLESI